MLPSIQALAPIDPCPGGSEAAPWQPLFDALPLPTLLLDRGGQILHANALALALLGGPGLAASDPASLLKALSHQNRARLRRALNGVARDCVSALKRLQLDCAWPGPRRIDVLLRRFEPGAGDVGAALILAQLVERPLKLRAGHDPGLLRDLLMSEAVFRNSNDAIFVIDARGDLLRVNPAFERLTGLSAAEVQGQSAKRLLRSAQPGCDLEQQIFDSLRRQGHWTGEALQCGSGERDRAVRLSIAALTDAHRGVQGYAVIMNDLTEARRASDEILRLATTDSLTGLPNRTLFLDRLNQAVSLARREQQSFALLFADLDHFKEVNDTLGHATGDELLVVIAHRLRDSVREMDTVARLGGDEFVMLLPNISREHALDLASRLVGYLRDPMALDGLPDYRAQASVGLVMFPDDGDSAEALLRHADQAMYAAKHAGRNQLQVYSAEMSQYARETFELHHELRQAIEHGQLEVYLQPKFRLADLAVVGAEALVRWQHPRLGLLGCRDFLHVAEQHQLLGAIDAWVMQTALRQVAAWIAQGRWPAGWKLALNQTAKDLQQPDWLIRLEGLLGALALEPALLEIELAEAIWSRPTPELIERLQQFRALGVTLLIDDFGTGYSSLSYLRQLPVGGVKIDPSFVHGMAEHEKDRVLLETLCELVRRLKLGLLAEGVETELHRQQLLCMGCPLGQGYLFSGPLPCAEFETRFLPPAVASPSPTA